MKPATAQTINLYIVISSSSSNYVYFARNKHIYIYILYDRMFSRFCSWLHCRKVVRNQLDLMWPWKRSEREHICYSSSPRKMSLRVERVYRLRRLKAATTRNVFFFFFFLKKTDTPNCFSGFRQNLIPSWFRKIKRLSVMPNSCDAFVDPR